MIERLQNIDRRIIFVLLFIVIGYPLVKPIGLPISIRSWVRTSYEVINNLNPGDRLILSVDYGVSMQADIHSQLVVIFDQMMAKNLNVIGVAFSAEGARFLSGFIGQYEAKGKKYGVDFCDLGYIPGGETALSAFGGDIRKTVPKDARGNEVASLPIMNGVNSVGDVKLFIGFESGGQARWWVRQLPQYKVPIVAGVVTVSATELEPYVQSKQLAGLIAGLRGAAEYETLLGKPGAGVAGMDAQSAGHMLIIILVLLCNVSMLTGKPPKKEGVK